MTESLEDEVSRLRAEVKAHEQRQRDDLISALAAARAEAAHWRQEANRLQQLGYAIDASHRETIEKLRSDIDTLNRARPRVVPVGHN